MPKLHDFAMCSYCHTWVVVKDEQVKCPACHSSTNRFEAEIQLDRIIRELQLCKCDLEKAIIRFEYEENSLGSDRMQEMGDALRAAFLTVTKNLNDHYFKRPQKKQHSGKGGE